METGVEYQIKDSGERRQFPSGAQRDRGGDKPRPDLISPFFLERFGDHMGKGAKKYSDHNWAKGMPNSEYWASLNRHAAKYAQGETDEDHLSAMAFNLMAIMHNLELGRRGCAEAAELCDFPVDWEGIMRPTTPDNLDEVLPTPKLVSRAEFKQRFLGLTGTKIAPRCTCDRCMAPPEKTDQDETGTSTTSSEATEKQDAKKEDGGTPNFRYDAATQTAVTRDENGAIITVRVPQ